MRKIAAAVVALGLLIGITIALYADCHDDTDCEEVEARLCSFIKWPTNKRTVDFYINKDYLKGSDDPDITSDVLYAAAVWSDISFDGETVDLRFNRVSAPGQPYRANVKDGKNTVGFN